MHPFYHGEIRYACIFHGELSNTCILHGELNIKRMHFTWPNMKAWYICTTYESLTVADILLGYEIKVTLNIIIIAF